MEEGSPEEEEEEKEKEKESQCSIQNENPTTGGLGIITYAYNKAPIHVHGVIYHHM